MSDPVIEEQPDKEREPVLEDWLLSSLAAAVDEVAHAEGGGVAELPLSLLTGGTLVSGVMVSPDEYYRRGQIPKVLAEVVLEQRAKARASGELLPPAYIHLRNPRFYQAGGTAAPIPVKVTEPPVYFRIRITAVDGFMLGVMASG